MPEIYVSTDVEADGPIPGPHSMLSFASAAYPRRQDAGRHLRGQPRHAARAPRATRRRWRGGRRSPRRGPPAATNPRDPADVMPEYVAWLKALPGKPVFVGYPAAYDFMFVYWYLIRFAGESPFSHSALDIKTYAMALLGTEYRDVDQAEHAAASGSTTCRTRTSPSTTRSARRCSATCRGARCDRTPASAAGSALAGLLVDPEVRRVIDDDVVVRVPLARSARPDESRQPPRTPLPFKCLHRNPTRPRSTRPTGWAGGRSMPISLSPRMALAVRTSENLPPFGSRPSQSAMMGGIGSSSMRRGASGQPADSTPNSTVNGVFGLCLKAATASAGVMAATLGVARAANSRRTS